MEVMDLQFAIHSREPEDLHNMLSQVDATRLLNFKDGYFNDTVLHLILKSADSQIFHKTISLMLHKAPGLCEERNQSGLVPLMTLLFAARGSYEVATALLKTRPSTCRAADVCGLTPLHAIALKFGHGDSVEKPIELAQLLLDLGSDVNAEDEEGKSPLYYALQAVNTYKTETDFSFIEFLLRNGSKLITKSNVNPLLANLFCVHLTEYLLKIDNSLASMRDKQGLLPIHQALQTFHKSDITLLEVLFHYNSSVKNTKPDLLQYAIDQRSSFKLELPFKFIEFLLKNLINPNINIISRDGCRLLDKYAICYQNIKVLIDLGANAKLASGALITAVQKCSDEDLLLSVQLLIEAGADPTQGLKSSDTNIFEVLCTRGVREDSCSKLLPVFQYLCNLPQFNNKLHNTSEWGGIDPQFIILESLNEISRNGAMKIIKCMVESKAFKPISQVKGYLELKVVNGTTYLFEKWVLTPIGSILNAPLLSEKLNAETLELMEIMLEHGFTLNQPEGRITTPLTVLLAADIADEVSVEVDASEAQKMKLFQTELQEKQMLMVENFILRGINVENMSLRMFVPQDGARDALQKHILTTEKVIDCLRKFLGSYPSHPTEGQLREDFTENIEPLVQKLWLPDSLWVAFLSDNIRAVKLLLPYWSGAPLLLLLFYPRILPHLYTMWFPILSQYGGVPHGTKEFDRLSRLITAIGINQADILEQFRDMQASPRPLQELSKYAVRAAYAKRASRPGISLPGLLTKVSPPGLRQYLLQQ